MKIAFLSLLLLLTVSFLAAQNPLLKNYSTNDGLPSYEIYMAMQDRNGYMWFATNYGVSRFDGYHFESFNMNDGLTDNTVFELFEDSVGRIWFITRNFKLSYWYNNKIVAYAFNANIHKAVDTRTYIENRSFYVDNQDNLYFSIFCKGAFVVNNKGIVKPYKENLTKKNRMCIFNVAPKKYINCSMNILDSSLYYEYNNISYSANCKFKSHYATQMNLFSTKSILFSSKDDIIYKIKDRAFHSYKMSDFIISLDEDKLGNIWVGLRNNGALCYPSGDFSRPPALHVLKGKPVSNIVSDRENGLWFTTTTSGVFYTPSLFFGTFTQSDGLIDNNIKMTVLGSNNSVFAISTGNIYNQIKNDLCASTNCGIPVGENILSVAFSDGKTWIGTDKCLYRIENGRAKKIVKDLCIVSISPAGNRELYICTKTCIGKVRNDSLTILPHPSLLMRFVNICRGADGKLFFSSYCGSGEIKNDSIIMLSDKFPELKVSSTWVLSNPVDTSVWIATKGEGIYILHRDKLSKLTMENGLVSNNVKHLVFGKNEIWASTNTGISRIYLKNKFEKKWLIQNINTDNGLISNDVNFITVSGEHLYVATDKGLTKFNARQIDTDLPKIHGVIFTRIKINEKDTAILSNYNLPYNTATITVSFGYMSYMNAGKLNYRYLLKGFSKNWNYTSSPEIRLTTLPPGRYTLEIYALFKDGDHCRIPALMTFIIHPPYWKTWWFILLVSVSILSVIVLSYIYRIRQINRRNLLRYQLFESQRKALSSRMNPHFIFNTLNSIQLYILKNDIHSSNKYLTKFASLMRNVLVDSNESSISLEKELNTLQTYIELEALRFDNKFECLVSVNENLNQHTIHIPTLLLQPFVENAIWHGLMNKTEKGFLSVTVEPEKSDCIRCIISDNGVGRKKAEEINLNKRSNHKSLGAKITQERLDLLNNLYNNKLKINFTDLYDESGNPAGTRVDLIIPILS